MEILIAVSVLSIVMLGIYSLLNSSVRITTFSKNKMLVIDKGYERLLKHTHYPRISLPSSETEGDLTINYTYKRESTSIPSVQKVQMQVESESSMVIYEYFEAVR